MNWLKPFMTERACKVGDVLFYKDEKAEEMFYIVSGRYRLVEMGIDLPVGSSQWSFETCFASFAARRVVNVNPLYSGRCCMALRRHAAVLRSLNRDSPS